MRIRKDPNCAVCGEHPTVTELIDYEAFCGTISEEAAEAARVPLGTVRSRVARARLALARLAQGRARQRES